jgi:hypothetical protein
MHWRKPTVAVQKCTASIVQKSYWIMVLVQPNHAFGEAIIKSSKTQNLFIHYLNNTYFSVLEFS